MAARGLPREIFQDDDLWLLAKAVHDFGERELVPYLRELGNDMRAKLSRTSQGWILSGEKTFITNGCHADLYVAIARAIGQDGRDAGITACVVERQGNQNSITSTPLHGKMGMWRTDTATVKFDNVLLTEDSILGPVGSAGQVARRVLSMPNGHDVCVLTFEPALKAGGQANAVFLFRF